jgi:hypothetical protein
MAWMADNLALKKSVHCHNGRQWWAQKNLSHSGAECSPQLMLSHILHSAPSRM